MHQRFRKLGLGGFPDFGVFHPTIFQLWIAKMPKKWRDHYLTIASWAKMLRGIAVLKSNYRAIRIHLRYTHPDHKTSRNTTFLAATQTSQTGHSSKNLKQVVLPIFWLTVNGASPAIPQVAVLDILMLQKNWATPVLQIGFLSLPSRELTYPL